MPINGYVVVGDTSILTITNVMNNHGGRYVCVVSSGSLSVRSNTAYLTIYGMVLIYDVHA